MITKKIIDKQIKEENVLFIPYLINFRLIGYKIIDRIKEINIYANMKLNFQNRKTSKNPKNKVRKVLVFFFINYYLVSAKDIMFAPIFNASSLF